MLIYKSENISVIIPQKCLKVLFELCEKANNLETGGIIYGNYSENLEDAIVYEFDKPPKDSKRGKTYFERGTFKVKEKIKKLWDKNIYFRRMALSSFFFSNPKLSRYNSDEKNIKK